MHHKDELEIDEVHEFVQEHIDARHASIVPCLLELMTVEEDANELKLAIRELCMTPRSREQAAQDDPALAFAVELEEEEGGGGAGGGDPVLDYMRGDMSEACRFELRSLQEEHEGAIAALREREAAGAAEAEEALREGWERIADVRAREAREAAIAAALARGATQAEAEREGDAAAAAARAAAEADENAAGGGANQPPAGGGGTAVVAGVGVAATLVIGALALAVRRRRHGGERGVADGATKPPMAAEADAGDTGPMQATKIFLGPANGQNPMWRNQQQPAGAPTTSNRFAAPGAAGASAKKAGVAPNLTPAAGSSIQLLSPKSFVALPAGWNEELDEASGKSYWWHTASGETTWDRPK